MEQQQDHRCGVCATPVFERNNYFYSKLMTVRDFFAEQRYFNEKRWLMNRMITGWGVVCGLGVRFKEGAEDVVIVSPGLAIDCCGREILICEEQEVELGTVESPCRSKATAGKSEPYEQVKPSERSESEGAEPKELAICLEYHECKTEAVQLASIACNDKERSEFNRIRDGFKIRVKLLSDVDIPDPFGNLCPLTYNKEHGKNESLHEFLCRNLIEDSPECQEHNCLILAKVTLPSGSGMLDGPPNPDPGYRRQLVYTNYVLRDLIHCFHDGMPHIININWKDTHAKLDVPWQEFVNILTSGLVVTFDKPMKRETINRGTFLISVIVRDQGTGYRVKKYVPAANVEYRVDASEYQAIFHVDQNPRGWWGDEIDGENSLLAEGADVEIILKGSSITEEHGRALDAAFIDGKFPTGNSVQGGDFVSWFSVGPRP